MRRIVASESEGDDRLVRRALRQPDAADPCVRMTGGRRDEALPFQRAKQPAQVAGIEP